MALGGLLAISTPPLAFIVSLVALLRKSGPLAAITGLVFSSLIMAFFLFGLITSLCR